MRFNKRAYRTGLARMARLGAATQAWLQAWQIPDEPRHPPASRDARLAPSGTFIAATFSNAAGERAYRLYAPRRHDASLLPLVVMLHGCRQDPAVFASGTRMNERAARQPCYVLYPAQPASANRSRCWNWYLQGNQVRDQGEPSIIADLTRQVMGQYPIDPTRVYVAGLSAGGAMAATMAATYPDLYAAAGVHSGIPHAMAHDAASALAVMRQGPRAEPAALKRAVPMIIFHGDQDATVHPSNGDHLAQQGQLTADRIASGAAAELQVEQGEVPGGRGYTRSLLRDDRGRVQLEHWLIHGGSHAWSGGPAGGSFTDPYGPDASAEMLRFFGQHRLVSV